MAYRLVFKGLRFLLPYHSMKRAFVAHYRLGAGHHRHAIELSVLL
jgi:hypothetical protein